MGQSVMLLLDGLDELRKALTEMPEAYRAEADRLVEDAAQNTARDLLAVYPGHGPLRNGVFVVDKSTRLQSRWMVQSRSRQAKWWEFGTQNRVTQKLWNRGAAPAHKDTGLVSIAKRWRKWLHEQLVEMLKSKGWEVTGG